MPRFICFASPLVLFVVSLFCFEAPASCSTCCFAQIVKSEEPIHFVTPVDHRGFQQYRSTVSTHLHFYRCCPLHTLLPVLLLHDSAICHQFTCFSSFTWFAAGQQQLYHHHHWMVICYPLHYCHADATCIWHCHCWFFKTNSDAILKLAKATAAHTNMHHCCVVMLLSLTLHCLLVMLPVGAVATCVASGFKN